MDSFTFKNILSSTYGIIVQELPSIIRPKMRTETIVIDGRDGEIINNLGYEAYDKSILIGIKSNQYINNINPWLVGSGDLILSDEPTMIYKASVVDAIELSRLIDYKTANIKFRVHPFKYLKDELVTENLTVTNQGNVTSLPLITITGSGVVHLLINGYETCILTIDGYLTLDSEKQEAYKAGVLKNRQMTGSFPSFLPGQNVISTMGTVTKIETLVRSRYI